MKNKLFYFINGFFSVTAIGFLFWLIYFRSGHSNAEFVFLPAVNASLNTASALLLICGYIFIRKKRINLHKTFMVSAFIMSSLFLICYVVYHSMHGDTPFLGQGFIRPVYFFILISHITLSIAVFPMIITTLYFALGDQFPSHKRIARVTLPIWLYVSITGVVVYMMLRIYNWLFFRITSLPPADESNQF